MLYFVFLVSCEFYVSLPHGAMGWSAVSDYFHLFFFILIHSFKIQQKSGVEVIMQFLEHRI